MVLYVCAPTNTSSEKKTKIIVTFYEQEIQQKNTTVSHLHTSFEAFTEVPHIRVIHVATSTSMALKCT